VLSEVEEKVAAQRSAGVDAATARATDRGARRPADETDREAARTLRGAVARKRPRKKTVPLAQRKWVQAVALLTSLAVLIGLVVWLTRPPSPEMLFARAKAAVETKDTDAALDATGRYLARYGDRGDEPTRQVRAWDRDLRVNQREYQLHNRYTSKFNLKPEDEGQKLAYEALRYENDGERDDADRKWKEMDVKFKDDPNPDVAVYAWLAQKKRAELARVPAREQQLLAELDRLHALRPPERAEEMDDAERACLQALRFETFGDLPAARDRWEEIRKKYEKDLDERGWMLLAAEKARELTAQAVAGKDKEKEFRLQLLQKQMAAADAVSPDADPNTMRKAVSICRDIIALYAKDWGPEVTAYARLATERLRALKQT
jgi:hypothetical protein